MKTSDISVNDFFVPGIDPGLALVGAEDWAWRPHPQAAIHGFSISAFPDQERDGNRFIRRGAAVGKFDKAIEFNSHLAVVDDLTVESGLFLIGGKVLLNAQHGMRLINRLVKLRKKAGLDFSGDIIRRFKETSIDPRMNKPLPRHEGDITGLDLVLDCRQSYNYYHFMTEVMCHLTLVARSDFTGNVYIHSPSSNRAEFIDKFIAAYFPELVGRVHFPKTNPTHYPRALIAFGLQQLYFMCGDGMMPSLDQHAPKNWRWRGREASRHAYGLIVKNSFENDMRKMRELCLAAVKAQGLQELPKRVWVTRNSAKTKRRPMENEAELVAALAEQGFSSICFEDLTPIEQVAHISQAEIIVLAHGAGLTNMMFAKADAVIVELSNLQTAINRFGDFHQHAHLAGCKYVSVLCDHAVENPEIVPSMQEHGHVGLNVPTEKIQTLVNIIATLTP